jgi:hypothetical protein
MVRKKEKENMLILTNRYTMMDNGKTAKGMEEVIINMKAIYLKEILIIILNQVLGSNYLKTEIAILEIITMESFKGKENTYGSIILITWVLLGKDIEKVPENGNLDLRTMNSTLDSLFVIKNKGRESIYGIIDAFTKEAFLMTLSIFFNIKAWTRKYSLS